MFGIVAILIHIFSNFQSQKSKCNKTTNCVVGNPFLSYVLCSMILARLIFNIILGLGENFSSFSSLPWRSVDCGLTNEVRQIPSSPPLKSWPRLNGVDSFSPMSHSNFGPTNTIFHNDPSWSSSPHCLLSSSSFVCLTRFPCSPRGWLLWFHFLQE